MRSNSLPHLILAALALFSAPVLPAATYVQNVLTAGPAAYWRFETVNDTSLSNGFVNTFQGNAAVTAAGQGVPLTGVANNRALVLTGGDGSVRTGVTNQLPFAGSGTIMMWVNFSQLPSVGNRTVELMVKSHFSSLLDFIFSADRLQGYAGDYTPVFYDFNPALATNTWYHLAFAFDSSAGFKRLYVNGVLVGDLPVNPNLTGSPEEIVLGNSHLLTDRALNGRMDEVALFERALTGPEIQALFASAGVATPAPQPVVRVKVELNRDITPIEQGQYEYWGVGIDFQISPAPFNSTNAVYSPHTNHHAKIGGPSGYLGGGGNIYGSFAEALTETTNGLWTLVLHEGEPNQQVYRFKINGNAVSLTTNDFASTQIISPVDDSTGNVVDVPFTWTQSAPWLVNNVDLSGPLYASTTVPPGATSWTNAPVLTVGRYYFNLHLRTNAARWLSVTTPTNATGALANWDGPTQLHVRREIRFRVGDFVPPPPGLQAHLRFDEEYLGFDSSSAGNNANTTWYDQPPTFVTEGKVGGAASFTVGGWLEFNQAFTPTLGGDFTVAVWVQTTQVAGNDEDPGSFGAGIVGGYIGSTYAHYTAPIVLNGSKAGFTTADDQNGEQTLRSMTSINSGAPDWVHVAVTRVQATGEKRLYINGVLEASETGTTALLEDTEAVRIGYGTYITYNGLLDDLQIYSGALPGESIAYLFANPGETAPSTTPLADAVDASQLPWTTGGNVDWFSQDLTTFDGVDAAQSGLIGDDEESWIQTTVTGPGTLNFWWKVSTESSDYLILQIDDTEVNYLSGFEDWTPVSWILPAGSHNIRWTYRKDSSLTDGDDAVWLDEVTFSDQVPPQITRHPDGATAYPGYDACLSVEAYGNPPPTYQWFKGNNPVLIPGATNNTLNFFSPVSSADADIYSVQVSNPLGTESTFGVLNVNTTDPLPPEFSWLRKPAGTTGDFSYDVATDGAGNVFTANGFFGVTDFGAGPLTNNSASENGVLVKYNASGTALWSRHLASADFLLGFKVAADLAGNAYITGYYRSNATFGPFTLTNAGGLDAYLAKYNSNGVPQWARSIGSPGFEVGNAVAVDPASGNVTVGGYGEVIAANGTNLVPVVGAQGFLQQFTPAGVPRWALTCNGQVLGLGVATNGHVYVSGLVSLQEGEPNFFIGTVFASQPRRCFIAWLDANGVPVYTTRFGPPTDAGNPTGLGDEGPKLSVQGDRVYVGGTFYSNRAEFDDFDINTINSEVSTNAYFAVYYLNLGIALATRIGDNPTIRCYDIAADTNRNIYIAGHFLGRYQTQSGQELVRTAGDEVQAPFFSGTQGFVAKYQADSSYQLWARASQATGISYFNGLAVSGDAVYGSGFFVGEADFGPFHANSTANEAFSYSDRSAFVARIGGSFPLPVALTIAPSGANVLVSYPSLTGRTYVLEAAPSLSAPTAWTPIRTNAGNGALQSFSVPQSGNPIRFFRARTQ